MAIDPRIAMGVQVGDVGQAIRSGLATGEAIATKDIREDILKQRQQMGEISLQDAQQAQALRGIQNFANVVDGLASIPDLSQRAKILAQQSPMLEEAGIPASQLSTIDLSDNGIRELQMSMKPFITGKRGVQSPAAVQTFQFYQGVLNDPNTTEDQKKAARIALKLEGPARTFAPKVVDIGGAKFLQVGDEFFNPQTMAPVNTDARGLPEGSTGQITEVSMPNVLTPDMQRDMKAQEAADLVEAKALAKQKSQNIITQQGQLSKIQDADIAYKALKAGDLDRIYGFGESWYPDFLRSEEGALLQARRDQIIGMLKLAARGELKGQGTISDSEQTTVSQAVTILEKENISPESAEDALDQAMSILYRNAGIEFDKNTNVDDDIDQFLNELGIGN